MNHARFVRGFVMIGLVALLAVGGGLKLSPAKADTWRGTAPFCNAKCLQNEVVVRSSQTGDGEACLTGKKLLCRHSPALANRCKQGFVWRGASPSDLVCVTPEQRDQAAWDNEDAASRIAPCRPGFVFRNAVPGDKVCVTPEARDLTARENQSDIFGFKKPCYSPNSIRFRKIRGMPGGSALCTRLCLPRGYT